MLAQHSAGIAILKKKTINNRKGYTEYSFSIVSNGQTIPLLKILHCTEQTEEIKKRRGALLKSQSAPLVEGFTVLTPSENKQEAFQAILLLSGKALSLSGQLVAAV